jgi:hypothetical protein
MPKQSGSCPVCNNKDLDPVYRRFSLQIDNKERLQWVRIKGAVYCPQCDIVIAQGVYGKESRQLHRPEWIPSTYEAVDVQHLPFYNKKTMRIEIPEELDQEPGKKPYPIYHGKQVRTEDNL